MRTKVVLPNAETSPAPKYVHREPLFAPLSGDIIYPLRQLPTLEMYFHKQTFIADGKVRIGLPNVTHIYTHEGETFEIELNGWSPSSPFTNFEAAELRKEILADIARTAAEHKRQKRNEYARRWRQKKAAMIEEKSNG
jgi:hypothetical protein